MNPQDCIRQFDALTAALIDTASLIYLDQIRCLDIAADALTLLIIPEVAKEYGQDRLPQAVERIPSTQKVGTSVTTDARLLETARRENLPVISEDKRVLQRADQIGLSYLNTLMLLNFMLYRRVLSAAAYEVYLSRLTSVARYSPWVYEFAGRVNRAVRLSTPE